MTLRVVVADDSLLLREGLTLLLGDAGHEVVAAVADGPSFVRAMAEHRPDLGITDVRMPPSHTDEGMRAAVEVRGADPAAKVLVLSQYVVLAYADELLADGRGGVGYLLKDRVSRMDQFLGAVEHVASGGTSLDPEVVSQLFAQRRAAADPVDTLTPREQEVLGLMAQGYSNSGIAREMFVTEGAVEKHASRIFAKLGLAETDQHRRVQAVLAWLRRHD